MFQCLQVHLDLWQKQSEIKDTKYGELTVRAKFQNTNLIIEVMNARNLIAMDSNGNIILYYSNYLFIIHIILGTCDSFVRMNLFPEDKFTGVTKPKTQTHSKTLFPLYEEKFVM